MVDLGGGGGAGAIVRFSGYNSSAGGPGGFGGGGGAGGVCDVLPRAKVAISVAKRTKITVVAAGR